MSTNFNCDWCQENNQATGFCPRHNICPTCHLKSHNCQSTCPCCWYEYGSKFIQENRICSVCLRDLKSTPGTTTCSNDHRLCSTCYKEGCVLCFFFSLRNAMKMSSLATADNIRRLLDVLSLWVGKSEKQHTDGEEPSMMEVDDYSTSNANEESRCMICLEDVTGSDVTLSVCQHRFHEECITRWFQSSGKQACPTCGHVYGISKGPQPSNGQMIVKYHPTPLPGFPPEDFKEKTKQTIEITYTFPSGIQGPLNPQPGQKYQGTVRRAYLPNNEEGQNVLALLRKAFEDQHIFTVGRSTTTGQENVVTWNDIHHKTSMSGGPQNFGYPDPTYLLRVREELAAKGYK